MSAYTMTFEHPTLKVADTQAALTGGDSIECQLTSAQLAATANYQTIEQRACYPPSQKPSWPSWRLTLITYQDWQDPDGICRWALTNRGKPMWFELVDDEAEGDTTTAVGQAYIEPVAYGGKIGGPGPETVNWQLLDEPDFTFAPPTP